jgi:hypothetical protein
VVIFSLDHAARLRHSTGIEARQTPAEETEMFDFITDNLDKIVPALLMIPVIAFGAAIIVTHPGLF